MNLMQSCRIPCIPEVEGVNSLPSGVFFYGIKGIVYFWYNMEIIKLLDVIFRL